MKKNRTVNLAWTAMAAILLAACVSRLTPENLARVKDGMSEQEVRTILGAPTETKTGSFLGVTGTTLVYSNRAQRVIFVFVNGKLFGREGTL